LFVVSSDRESHPPSTQAPDLAGVLVANHRQFLGFLEKRVGSRALAEDILQDAFVRGMNKLDTLRSDESAIAWFYRVLRNAVIDYQRRRGASERKLAAFGNEMERSHEPDVELRGAICHCVGELAATLEPKYKEALESVELGELPVKDYAARAGISPSNAGVRLHRARRALLERVQRCCGSCAEHGCLDCTCGSRHSAPE
jgi:RNA polymerase sigma-70 factor (ECF subfamily)